MEPVSRMIAERIEQSGPMTTQEIMKEFRFPASEEELIAFSHLSRHLGIGYSDNAWHSAATSEAVAESLRIDSITSDQAELILRAAERTPFDDPRPLTSHEVQILRRLPLNGESYFGSATASEVLSLTGLVRMGMILSLDLVSPGQHTYRITSRGVNALQRPPWML